MTKEQILAEIKRIDRQTTAFRRDLKDLKLKLASVNRLGRENIRGGEWFDLNASDVNAFKRRKFM